MQVYSNTQLEAKIIDWPVYMQRALDLAEAVLSAAPNPRVGCVIVRENKIVGEGWHSAAGQVHAEIMALQLAGNAAQQATAFVTLEPCSHTGRTGPCCDAIITSGIKRVVIAGIDPNPEVSGKGVARLEAAGIEVIQLQDFEQAAEAINPGYFRRRREGRPFVRCKLAMSLDGRTALASGISKWITGAAARADVQRLRARSCAVVTGIGTVLADDPAMTVRIVELGLEPTALEKNANALARHPLRVILDSNLRTPGTARILGSDDRAIIYTTQATGDQFPVKSVDIISVPAKADGVCLQSVLESLASKFEVNEVLLEAGSTLSAAFISAGLVDEFIVYVAPKLLGSDGRALLEVSGLESLSESIEFNFVDTVTLGSDIRLTLVPRKSVSN